MNNNIRILIENKSFREMWVENYENDIILNNFQFCLDISDLSINDIIEAKREMNHKMKQHYLDAAYAD